MDENERIRRKAHQLWEGEGRPEGRADSHWEEAREIVALEDGAGASALTPVEDTVSEPVEPAGIVRKHGDVPGLSDLGETDSRPSREAAAAIAAVKTPGQGKTSR